MGESHGILNQLTKLGEKFVDMLSDDLREIFTHTKNEIMGYLENIDEEQLLLLRQHMVTNIVQMFAEYQGQEAVTRRKRKPLIEDIYTVGYSLVNKIAWKTKEGVQNRSQ